MRPAFSRRATFTWFTVVFVGFVMRGDTFGVSSIVRSLWLAPACYPCLLHFFHSTAWQPKTLLACWWQWLVEQNVAHLVNGRIVLLGDHTKVPKDGRRMPEVSTLHQDSETGSKPSFFRGHLWGAIGMLVETGKQYFATPLWAEIHRDELEESTTTRIVTIAGQIAETMGRDAYLVLDAYFAVGPVFVAAANMAGRLHILTRAKKNVVAYRQATQPKKKPRGHPRKYGEKLKLMKLFDSRSSKFQTAHARVYDKWENVRYLTLDLLWKPTKGLLRFILIETSRGRMILITSDFNLGAVDALKLYCRRVGIETMFDVLKNVLGGLCYHFWSKYLELASRRPTRKKDTPEPVSSRPEKTRNTLAAIEKFVVVQLVVLGALQLIARRFGTEVYAKARCWLRTAGGEVPSEFVTRMALANVMRKNLFSLASDWITRLILGKQETCEDTDSSQAA